MGGGGGECQPIKVMRSRVYPLGQLPTIIHKLVEIVLELSRKVDIGIIIGYRIHTT